MATISFLFLCLPFAYQLYEFVAIFFFLLLPLTVAVFFRFVRNVKEKPILFPYFFLRVDR